MASLEEKKYNVGSFYIEKSSIPCSVEELDKFPKTDMFNDIKKELEETGRIPIITIGDNANMWKTSYKIGTQMYEYFDTFETTDGEITEPYAEDFISTMYLVVGVVGDSQFFRDRIRIIQDFTYRLTEKTVGEESE